MRKEKMNIGIEQWFFMLFIFMIIGWIYESTVESIYHKKLINRGSLKGPYIPIYGFGGCLMLIVCMPFRENGFLVFLTGLTACTILEYFTGWLMEKLFKKQFWDYSMFKLVYKNRISLASSLTWGALSLFQVYILFPFLNGICKSLGSMFMWIFSLFMMTIVFTDLAFVIKKTLNWRLITQKLSADRIKFSVQKAKIRVVHIFRPNDPEEDQYENDDNKKAG